MIVYKYRLADNSYTWLDETQTPPEGAVIVETVGDEIQKDAENAPLQRLKMAPSGWTYNIRGMEIKTSTTEIINRDALDSQMSDATVKLFDVNGVEITDPAGYNLAVKTQIDLTPNYDYEIVGVTAKILSTPASSVSLSVIAVPELPYAYGGSRVMVQNVNFKFITAESKIEADGRTSKRLSLPYTTLRFSLYHQAGEQHEIGIYLEHYKA